MSDSFSKVSACRKKKKKWFRTFSSENPRRTSKRTEVRRNRTTVRAVLLARSHMVEENTKQCAVSEMKRPQKQLRWFLKSDDESRLTRNVLSKTSLWLSFFSPLYTLRLHFRSACNQTPPPMYRKLIPVHTGNTKILVTETCAKKRWIKIYC